MSKYRIIIFIIFYLLLSIGNYFVWGMSGVIKFFLVLHIYIGVFLGIAYLIRKIAKKNILPLRERYEYYITRFTISLASIILLVGGFSVYHNIIAPAKLPQVTLSNGNQSIVFQTMSHIASETFYSEVQKMIHSNKESGYVLYFEGVTPGSEENSEKFNTALGVDIQNGLYEKLGALYGTVHQENENFLNIINNKDYNIDLSIDQVVEIYEQKQGNIQANTTRSEQIDISPKIQEILKNFSPKELRLLQFYNQAILNFMMKNNWIRNILIKNFSNQGLFDVILDDRNLHLVDEIEQRKDKKIIILYGLMHYEGVLKELQKRDPNWKALSTTYLQVIQQDFSMLGK